MYTAADPHRSKSIYRVQVCTICLQNMTIKSACWIVIGTSAAAWMLFLAYFPVFFFFQFCEIANCHFDICVVK